jgi:hypothetical protein
MKNILIILIIISCSIIGQTLIQNFNVEQKINGSAKQIGEYNFVEYSVLANDGRQLYKIVDKTDYDIPYSKLEVFKTGSSVLINAFYGTLTFISNNGSKTKSVKISDDIKVEYERNILSVADDNKLIIMFGEHNTKSSTIKIFNEFGILENAFEIPIVNGNGIAYSESLNQIFVSHVDWSNSGEVNKKITILNSGGEVVKLFDANFEKGFFVKDSLFIAFTNNSFLSFDTKNLKLNFEKKSYENQIILDANFADEKIFIASAKPPKLLDGKWHYKNPIISELDKEGKLIGKEETIINSFTEFKLVQSENKMKLIFNFADK